MTNRGSAILGFLAGAIVGAGAVYLYLRKNDEEEVIDYVPNSKKSSGDISEKHFDDKLYDSDNAIVEYQERIRKESYSQQYNDSVELKKDQQEAERRNKPYVIAPEEFGELPEYSKFTMKYFKDGYLIDDRGDPVDDVNGTIGDTFMDHFGEYEEDAVYIRNDKSESDYEILYVDEPFIDNE